MTAICALLPLRRFKNPLVPGFKFSVFSYLMSLLHPRVIADLELSKYGYKVLPATDMFGVLPGNDYIIFADDIAKTQKSFKRFSPKDAAIYPEFDRYLMESVKIMRRLLLETPPDPSCRDWRAFKETAKFLWKYRRVGNKLFRLVDLMTMSADDYLSEWFERTEIKAVLAYYSGIGTFVGPKSPGSAYVIMHHVMGEHAGAGGWGFVRGGMGAITQAIARSGKEKGLACKTDCEVSGIDSANGRATGVTLTDGTRYEAGIVASNVSAKLTFLKFLDNRSCRRSSFATLRRTGRFRPRSRSTSPGPGRRTIGAPPVKRFYARFQLIALCSRMGPAPVLKHSRSSNWRSSVSGTYLTWSSAMGAGDLHGHFN